MYREAYGLTHHPFEKDIEPDKLFSSNAAEELEARLKYLLQLRSNSLRDSRNEGGEKKTRLRGELNYGFPLFLFAALLMP